LVVDTDLEASGTPVNELDGFFRLDVGNGGVHVFGHDVTSVQQAASHVFTMAGIAFHHLVSWFEAGVGHLGDGQLLVVSLLGRDDWRVRHQGEVNAGVGHQISLELREIDIEGAVESQRGRDGRDDLSDEAVQVRVGRSLDVQVPSAEVVDGFVVDHERTV